MASSRHDKHKTSDDAGYNDVSHNDLSYSDLVNREVLLICATSFSMSSKDNHSALENIKNDTEVEDLLYVIKSKIAQHSLPIDLSIVQMQDEPVAQKLNHSKITKKYCQKVSEFYKQPVLLVDSKAQLSMLIDGIKVAPNWAGMQRRIVSAGRKSELLLQATKLTLDHRVLDATAGFGHDSLILGSTGATVTLLEREPLLALMLLMEQAAMSQHKNWQKLMSRMTIIHSSAEAYLEDLIAGDEDYDVIYLDPMFPDGSYHNTKPAKTQNSKSKGAKVGKHMQALHGLVRPPTEAAEHALFDKAYTALNVNSCKNNQSDKAGLNHKSRRLIIKRPISAPHFANRTPDEVWQNEVVRFEGYFV